jgi:hypothetical protein
MIAGRTKIGRVAVALGMLFGSMLAGGAGLSSAQGAILTSVDPYQPQPGVRADTDVGFTARSNGQMTDRDGTEHRHVPPIVLPNLCRLDYSSNQMNGPRSSTSIATGVDAVVCVRLSIAYESTKIGWLLWEKKVLLPSPPEFDLLRPPRA